MLLPWLGPLLAIAGAVWVMWTARILGWRRRQRTGPSLILRGPYRFVRHPACTGVLCFLLGALVWDPGWVTAAGLLSGITGVGSWIGLAENRCLSRFGEAYRRYQTAVPALFPLRLRRQTHNSLPADPYSR